MSPTQPIRFNPRTRMPHNAARWWLHSGTIQPPAGREPFPWVGLGVAIFFAGLFVAGLLRWVK